jgi:hypothetical protein
MGRDRANGHGGARRAEAAPRDTAPASKYVQYADADAAPRCIHLDHGVHPPAHPRGL